MHVLDGPPSSSGRWLRGRVRSVCILHVFVEELHEELDGVTDDLELPELSCASATESVPAVSDTEVTVVVGGIHPQVPLHRKLSCIYTNIYMYIYIYSFCYCTATVLLSVPRQVLM